MTTYRAQVEAAAAAVAEKIGIRPRIAVLTGTGLGDVAGLVAGGITLSYDTIPHFPVSTAPGHHGRLVAGRLNSEPVAVLQGRVHLYEGYTPQEVGFPVRVMRQLGVEILIISNAAGGLNPDFRPGDIMIVSDHINLTGQNPLTGPNIDSWGLRFPDMTAVYDRRLAAVAAAAAKRHDIALQSGVYAGLSGPSLETPAETRFLRRIGADAVGFSTVQEAIAGVHAGLAILGLSVITNLNLPDHPAPTTLEDVLAVAATAAPRLTTLIQTVVEALHDTTDR